jgi:ATP-binding cassette subfamily B multidrug efflux pump
LSTVRNADEILVLEKGEIIERGNHEALLQQKGRYFELYTGQFN